MHRLTARVAVGIAIGLVITLAAAGLWVRHQLRGSLPALDGQHRLSALAAPVSVTRDALGIPTIEGRSRDDVARALGFLHGQERFFQMDLARRRAAGELSALVGARALPADRAIRIHRFRQTAQRAVASMGARDRRILDAYVAGVNSGLDALATRPFEYLLLRQSPMDWKAEDTMLVVLSMFITLQDADGSYESTLATMHDVLPPAMVEFLAPATTAWESTVAGTAAPVPPIPDAATYDLRRRRGGRTPIALPGPRPDAVWFRPPVGAIPGGNEDDVAVGSNNFAVAGHLTGGRGALVANDMHLAVRVPNTWYRAAMKWTDGGTDHQIVGVTLPGTPAFVVGSNGFVSWSFTNTYADFGDVILLDVDPMDGTRYRTPSGWRTLESHDEVIQVAGEDDEHIAVVTTIWGPVIRPDFHGRTRAYRWAAHDAARLAAAVTPLERARTLEEAFDEANGLGTPAQNMVAADRSGRIGWTIFGSLPQRIGFDGRLPTSWSDGARRWNGWLAPSQVPRVIDPPSGRLWSANARVVGDDIGAALGDGNYEVGSRARLIRDRLMARDSFAPSDLLAIQLDTSATFLARWHDLLLQTLTPAALAGHDRRAAMRDALQRTWTNEASPDSVAYRLTRLVRDDVSRAVFSFLLSECYDADPWFDYTYVRRREEPIWRVIEARPEHLLDPQFVTWDALLLASIDRVMEDLDEEYDRDLMARTWGEYNVTRYRHPLSAALPFVSRWLDMPAQQLAGDLYTPNMHWGANAPSERMIVSPGREAEGMLHMPTGQSGHPLSPFYGNSHEAWVAGRSTPLLPGAPRYTLTLVP